MNFFLILQLLYTIDLESRKIIQVQSKIILSQISISNFEVFSTLTLYLYFKILYVYPRNSLKVNYFPNRLESTQYIGIHIIIFIYICVYSIRSLESTSSTWKY